MTEKQRKDRERQSQEIFEVKQNGAPHTYLVSSQSNPGWFHKVVTSGTPRCSCKDFARHIAEDPTWRCKHYMAAFDFEMNLGRVEARADSQANGNGIESAPQAGVNALFGGQPAAAVSDFARRAIESYRAGTWEGQGTVAEPLQDEPSAPQAQGMAAAVEEIPQEEPLAPCSECGELFPVSKMLPWDAHRGTTIPRSGLICAECHQAHKELAAEMKAEREVVIDTPSATRPMTLADAYPLLTRPFEIAQVEVKPGAVNGTKALALAYVDMRAYQARLDEAVGPESWSVEYRPLGASAAICKLTILGTTRENVGEADPEDSNAWTSAVAQSFKRACASFGLGRYLYQLPRLWADYDPQKKIFRDTAKGGRADVPIACCQGRIEKEPGRGDDPLPLFKEEVP